jgi:hypothetical protein
MNGIQFFWPKPDRYKAGRVRHGGLSRGKDDQALPHGQLFGKRIAGWNCGVIFSDLMCSNLPSYAETYGICILGGRHVHSHGYGEGCEVE